MTLQLTTTAFMDGGAIGAELAFGAIDATTHVKLAANRNPDFAWSGLPSGTLSLCIVCHDPDVPSRGDDVNKEGRSVPATLSRVDFFHWSIIDLPPDTKPIARGEFSDGVASRGKPGPHAPRGALHGLNDYTGWFANDPQMAGDYFGYDGPCPPWNDTIPHRYVFTLYALDVPKLVVPPKFTGQDVLRGMQGHVLAEASVTGRYSLNPAVKV